MSALQQHTGPLGVELSSIELSREDRVRRSADLHNLFLYTDTHISQVLLYDINAFPPQRP